MWISKKKKKKKAASSRMASSSDLFIDAEMDSPINMGLSLSGNVNHRVRGSVCVIYDSRMSVKNVLKCFFQFVEVWEGTMRN